MQEYLRTSIVFDGATAANGIIDFYDVQRALQGFQRTLSLVTHLALNGEIITQSPSLKGAEILAIPPEVGSWKFTAVIVSSLTTGIYTVGTASTDTPIGYLVSSLLDFTLNKSFGIELDYEKTIRQLIEEKNLSTSALPTPEQLNSLAEKTQNSIIDMHRPIEKGSAKTASIQAVKGGRLTHIGPYLDLNTLTAAKEIIEINKIVEFKGKISSYNMNTHTGRIYLPSEQRTIPFQLARDSISREVERNISRSLDSNIAGMPDEGSEIILEGIYYLTKSGELSKIIAVDARQSKAVEQ
ncbi:hypothetical protein DXT91_17130 [Agrobacterium tumefaciens]|uniref:DUF7946 domain-containing protein n=1 Tax=Agrobacterium tumefaciens TaxID=358 RepID=UPI0012B89854|nr:hypothetical protein [Agrobacterium tumefaciens]MQB05835.1 hypothetical protein [Agrobacterium tumefaciens]